MHVRSDCRQPVFSSGAGPTHTGSSKKSYAGSARGLTPLRKSIEHSLRRFESTWQRLPDINSQRHAFRCNLLAHRLKKSNYFRTGLMRAVKADTHALSVCLGKL